MTLLASDYLIFMRVESFLSSYRFILYFDYYSFTGDDNVFPTQVTILLCLPGFTMMSPLSKLFQNFVPQIICLQISTNYYRCVEDDENTLASLHKDPH